MRLLDMMKALRAYKGGRLYAVPEEKLEEIRTAPFYAPHMAKARAAADTYAGQLIPSIPYSYFKLYDEVGSRTEFQSIYHIHRNILGAYYVAALVDGTHIHDLEDAIWATCDEYSWCLNAHFVYGGTKIPSVLNGAPKGDGKPVPFLREQPQVVDLCAAQTAADLAEIVYMLEDKLAPVVVHRARKEVYERVLKPFMEINTPFWWETSPYNWSAVCAGGVGIAAMYMIDDNDMLAPILTRCTESMEGFFTGFKADGVCAEGLGYWGYGFGHFMVYADLLKERTGGVIDLFEEPIVHKVALFHQNAYLIKNNAACFADCGATALYEYGVIHYLHNRYGDVLIPDEAYARPMFPGTENVTYCTSMIRNFLWSKPENVSGPLSDSEALYNETEWLLSRKSFGDVSVAMGAKGGNNNEPHNHNDVGSFVLDVNGEVILGDLGGGLYTKQYFSSERYTMLVNGSHGHPVPVVNGAVQKAGEEYAAKNYTSGSDAEKIWACMDIADAYQTPGLASLQRCVTFHKDEIKLEVADTYGFDGEALPVLERLSTKFLPEVQEDGTVVIRAENAAVRVACSLPCRWEITAEEYASSKDPHQKAWLLDAVVAPANGETVTLTVTLA